MNKEELAYNDYYERTKDYGRSQFVKLIVATEEEKRLLNNRITKLQQENNQLKEQLKDEEEQRIKIAKDRGQIYKECLSLIEQRQELRTWLEEDNDKINVLDAKDNSLVKLGIMIGLGMCLDKLNELEGGKNE